MQLELEFAAKLAALDELAGKVEDDEASEAPKPERDKGKKKHGHRDLRLFDLPEERIEIPDPLLDGKTARTGTEESIELKWKRGGFVRVVLVRFKYDATTPATVAAPIGSTASGRWALGPLPALGPLACSAAWLVVVLGVCDRPRRAAWRSWSAGRSRSTRRCAIGWALAVGSARRARSRSGNFIRRRSNGGSFAQRLPQPTESSGTWRHRAGSIPAQVRVRVAVRR